MFSCITFTFYFPGDSKQQKNLMGGNISFEWGVYGPNCRGNYPMMISGDADVFWDEVMMDVCHSIVAWYIMEKEHTTLSYRRMRYVIEFMLNIDVSKWSDKKIRKFSGVFLYLDFNNFTRVRLQEILKQRTEYQKYLLS